MKAEPAAVWRIWLSRKSRRNWTSGASAEPNVAVAIRQDGNCTVVVVEVEVVVDVTVGLVVVVVTAVDVAPVVVVPV